MDTVSGDLAVSSRSHLTPPQRSCLHSPCTLSGAIAMHCPPPREGAGGGRVSGRAVGVFQRKPFNGRRMRQGRGMFHPPPRQPHPRGGDSPAIPSPGSASPHPVPGENPPEESCSRPLARPPPAGWRAWQPQKTSQRRGDPGHHTMSDLALWAFIPAPPGEPLNWSLTGAGIVVLLVAVTNIPPNKRISSQMSWHSLTG